MTAIVLAAAAVLIIGVTAAVAYVFGRERGYHVGYMDGHSDGYDRGHDMGEIDGFQEGFGAGEMHHAAEYGEVTR